MAANVRIDNIPAGPPFAHAVVDSVTTLNPGEPATATATATFDGTDVHLSFGIPRGSQGNDGAPGEVSQQALGLAVAAVAAGSSANSNAVATLGLTISDPPTQAELQAVVAMLDELLLTLRRA